MGNIVLSFPILSVLPDLTRLDFPNYYASVVIDLIHSAELGNEASSSA